MEWVIVEISVLAMWLGIGVCIRKKAVSLRPHIRHFEVRNQGIADCIIALFML